jgi:predicted enzyme related to lactoylglutathione lyase
VDLGSPDLDASKAFYGALFGWEAAASDDPQTGGYTMFTSAGRNVAGLGPLFGEGQRPSWSTYFAVEDVERTVTEVQAAGGQVLMDVMDVMDVGRMAVLADPTGVAFSLWQPGTHPGFDVVDEPGSFAWAELATRDPGTSLPFFTTVFGWQPRTSEGYTELQLGSSSVAGCMDVPEAVPEDVPGYWLPYFAVEDPDVAAGEAAGLGATVVVPDTPFPGGRFAVVQDPHGAAFGLLRTDG